MNPLFDRAYWEDRYGSSEKVWSGNPNPVLVEEVTGLAPGTALDIGSGEGADSLWLARRGWSVTGVDISQVALDRAAAHAEAADPEAAARLRWEQHDFVEWSPAASRYDLISAQFMHLPGAQMNRLVRALAEAIAPGGTLLIVGHDISALEDAEHAEHMRDMMYTADEIWGMLPAGEFTSVVCESRERRVVSSTPAHPHHLRDVVVRAERRDG